MEWLDTVDILLSIQTCGNPSPLFLWQPPPLMGHDRVLININFWLTLTTKLILLIREYAALIKKT